jgi:hypothetical protein
MHMGCHEKAYLKIMVNSDHDITRIRAVVMRHNPNVVVLESECPTANNRVIRYAQYFREKWMGENEYQIKNAM